MNIQRFQQDTVIHAIALIMGVPFPSLDAWESAAAAIDSNMFEGYEPPRRGIEIIRDYTIGKISFDAFIRAAVDKAYAEEH